MCYTCCNCSVRWVATQGEPWGFNMERWLFRLLVGYWLCFLMNFGLYQIWHEYGSMEGGLHFSSVIDVNYTTHSLCITCNNMMGNPYGANPMGNPGNSVGQNGINPANLRLEWQSPRPGSWERQRVDEGVGNHGKIPSSENSGFFSTWKSIQ